MAVEEYDVEVVYRGQGWRLVLEWTTDFSHDEEVTIDAATEWFEEQSGWNPSDDALDVVVNVDWDSKTEKI